MAISNGNRQQQQQPQKKAGLSRTTKVVLLVSIPFTLLSLNNVRIIQRVFRQQQERACGQQQELVELLPPAPPPSILSDLLHLFETLPNATTPQAIPPFREVSYAYPRLSEMNQQYITLSTQLSVSKLPRLVQLLDRWRGPISCAVHLPDTASIVALNDFWNTQDKLFRTLITFHVMLERSTEYYEYPINRMRNLALKNIDTDFFFLCDADFMPRQDALYHLLRFLSKHTNAKETFQKLYVLPAFEVFGDGNSTVKSLKQVPETKAQLRKMVKSKKVKPFHMDYFEAGHGPTNYKKWFTCPKDGSYAVEYRWRYEPHVVGVKYGIPAFNEQIRSFGYNKASWVAEAHSMGYQFEVLCDHFVVHMNHPRRQPPNNAPAIDWYQKVYLPLKYNISERDLYHTSKRENKKAQQRRRQRRRRQAVRRKSPIT
jgi:glycosyltransferase-like protein LARGE